MKEEREVRGKMLKETPSSIKAIFNVLHLNSHRLVSQSAFNASVKASVKLQFGSDKKLHV